MASASSSTLYARQRQLAIQILTIISSMPPAECVTDEAVNQIIAAIAHYTLELKSEKP